MCYFRLDIAPSPKELLSIITFISQKKKNNIDTVTHHTDSRKKQNLVKIWATFVNHIMAFPGAAENSPFNSFFNNVTKIVAYITSK